MKVWSATPLPTAAMLWQSSAGAWTLTVVAKATFAIEPGESPLAAAREPVHDDDLYDVRGQLWAPTDLVPFKPRADVLLVGSAYSPRSIDAVVARLIVGGVEKAIEVRTNHYFDPDGQLVEGQHWVSMPLGWDHAAGGEGTSNPAGISPDTADRNGRTPLPNQLAPGTKIGAPGDYLEPIAFAPVPPAWAMRSRFAGNTPVHPVLWYDEPLPGDLHPAFFNSAPPDQQPEFLPEEPRIILEHLSPLASRVTTTLSPVRVAVYLEGRTTGSFAMRADTLWIDTEQQICTVTYRATVPIGQPDPAGVATIVSDPPTPLAEPVPVPVYGRDAGAIADPATNDELPPAAAAQQLSPAERRATSPALLAADGLPFAAAAPSPWPERESAPPATPPARDRGLPFQRSPAPTRPIEARTSKAATPFENRSALLAPPLAPPAAPALAPPPAAPPLAPPLVPPHAPPPTTPPPPVRAMEPSAPVVAMPAKPPPIVRPIEARPAVVPSPSPSQPGLGAQPWAFTAQPEPPKRVVHEARAALDGVAGASNAASDRQAAEAPGARIVERPRVTSNDVVDLVWFAEGLPLRVRRYAPWSDAVRDEAKVGEWVPPEEAEKQAKDDTRRFVTRALGRVSTTEPASLTRLLAESVDEEGFIDRPLVVVAGELAVQLDGIELFKSTVELAGQLAMSDKLKEALEGAKELAQAQRVSTPLIENLLARIRREFAQANRTLPNDYLESTVHRTMLEERKYQKRHVLGEAHLVGLLHTGGSAHAAPTYLPEHLGARIPALPRFKVRLVCEPHPSQHPSDGDGAALRVLALGRVVGSRNRGA